jgi:sugar phosphate isomerase/epimerase
MRETTLQHGEGMDRRHFIGAASAAAAGWLGAAAFGPGCAPRQERKLGMKIGLYSITFLGVWYRGEALSLEDLVKTAGKYGYDGVEIDGKRPHGNPLDWPAKRCRALRSVADGEGIDIHAVAANNDFSNPVPEVREAQICGVRELIRMTGDLGARNLRVFLAWWGVTKHPQIATYRIAEGLWPVVHREFSEEEIWGWCRDSLIECARYAEDAGVTLALQNHPPVIRDHNDVLRMVGEVNSPNLKICLDVPLMRDKSAAAIQAAAEAVGPMQVLSHFGGEFERKPDGTLRGYERHDGIVQGDTNRYYGDFVRAMRGIGYEGYISYELCHDLPVVNGRTVGIEFAHEQARLAAEFMRGLIRES